MSSPGLLIELHLLKRFVYPRPIRWHLEVLACFSDNVAPHWHLHRLDDLLFSWNLRQPTRTRYQVASTSSITMSVRFYLHLLRFRHRQDRDRWHYWQRERYWRDVVRGFPLGNPLLNPSERTRQPSPRPPVTTMPVLHRPRRSLTTIPRRARAFRLIFVIGLCFVSTFRILLEPTFSLLWYHSTFLTFKSLSCESALLPARRDRRLAKLTDHRVVHHTFCHHFKGRSDESRRSLLERVRLQMLDEQGSCLLPRRLRRRLHEP